MNPRPAVQPSLAVRLFGGDPRARLALLRAAWPLAVGSELARRTEVLEAQAGTLRVRVPDAAWRKVLHAMQPRLRARLREVVGTLAPTRLSFQEAPLSGTPAADDSAASTNPAWPPTHADTQAGERDAPESVRLGAEAIADPDIRARFLRSAARALARAPHHHPARPAEGEAPRGEDSCK